MTQEDKELLLEDLCARLPYGVKFKYKYIDEFFHENYSTSILTGVRPPYHIEHHTLVGNEYLQIEKDEIKPYLLPLSSMTEEQMKECLSTKHKITKFSGKFMYLDSPNTINYYYKNHFDYRGLISKGLANDATGLNIY